MSPPELEDELEELEELLDELDEELLDELDEFDDELLELELFEEELALLEELELLDELELLELPELDPLPPQATRVPEISPSARIFLTLNENESGLLIFMIDVRL